MLALCAMVTGCASSNSPISLTQWSWGRSLSLSKDREQPPSFEDKSETESTEDVTVVDPDSDAETPSEPKEPRRLFGFGGKKKSEDEIQSNRTHHDRSTVPKIERDDVASNSHWYDRFRPSRTVPAMVNNESEQRRQREIYDEAEQLYKDQHYAEAAKLLKPLTKKKQSFWQRARFWSVEPDYREDHNRVREDSMFLLAESNFKQERFADAKDYYEVLLKEYPSTRHLNTATKRQFAIARTWLGFPEFASNSTSQETKTATFGGPGSEPHRQEPADVRYAGQCARCAQVDLDVRPARPAGRRCDHDDRQPLRPRRQLW